MVMIERALCPVLVGRADELSILEDALLAANRGQGSVVALAGDAGLGKTRLATELERRARAVNMDVLSGGCSEADLSLPYLPLLEAIGNYLAMSDLDSLRARLGPATRELGQLFPQIDPSVTPSEGVESAQAKLRLFEAMISLLSVPAETQGLLLIIEDLHWADASTRELLDYMTRRLRQLRIMVLATYRRDEMHRKHPLAPIVQAWRRSGSAKIVELNPLSTEQIESMVRAIFDVDEVSAEFRDFLHERSEGNPFVLEEMLKEAMDRGDVYRTETGEWERKDLAQLTIPQSVSDSIMARVERLDPDTADLLAAAAVLGPTFEYEVLLALTGLPEATVQAGLVTCVQQQLIVQVERSPGTYHFRHALTREAIYEDLILPRRQQLHAAAAEVLKGRAGTRPIEIASHLLAAGNYEGAVPLCLQAADEAMAAVAFPEACSLWERALPFISDVETRARVLYSLGHAFCLGSEPTRAQAYLDEAVDLYERMGDKEQEARARLWRGRSFWEQSRVLEAKDEYERAREIFEEAGPSEDLAVTYVRLSGLAIFDFRAEEGRRFAEAAIETAQRAGVDLPRVWAYNFLGVSKAYVGEVDEGMADLKRSYEEAVVAGFHDVANNALHNTLATAIESLLCGEMGPVLDKLDEGPATVWPIGPTFRRGVNDFFLGMIDRSVDELERALAHTRALQNPTVEGWIESALVDSLREQGRLHEARQLLQTLDPSTERQELLTQAVSVINFHLAAEEPDAARAAVQVLERSGDWYLDHPYLVLACVQALIAAGMLDEAGSILARAVVRHERSQRPFLDLAEGELQLARGDAPAARDFLARSAEAFKAAQYRIYEMRARMKLAEALHAIGDPDAARAELESVVSTAIMNGARLRLAQARALAARLGIELPDADVATDLSGDELVETGERLVTILFADVRGYTAMTNERAPQEMADRIGSFHRWAQQEIDKHGGLVDKFAGDAVMATFNVTGRSTDHTVRALDAGIALQDKAALAGLPVGVGIAVGAAIVGRFADGANVSVLGETTNLSARLQAQAGAGEIALNDEAYRRTKDWLAARNLTVDPVTVELKGFDAPVNAFMVRARG